jgi:oligopeptide/dipeptide ABC transporter ATP-binding protein
MNDNLLSITNLKKHFVIGHKDAFNRQPITVKAVDGFSCFIQEGETLGLVGESGSGKSTVAYMVVGMYTPSSGEIKFRGQDLFINGRKRPLRLRKEIQIVFQDPGSSLNPRQTIKQILELPLRIHQPDANPLKEIVRLLEMVELPIEYIHKYPQMLGGGEKQMVAIARALATRPALIILDEPTSALDVSIQGKIINLLLRLQKEFNLTYLFITHDLSLMRNVASRVVIMYLGKICEVAEASEFFQNPKHPYTQMLLSSIPVVSDAEEAMKPKKITPSGEIPSPVNVPIGCSFNTRCPRVMDICGKVDPIMISIDKENNHDVRCHLFCQSEEATTIITSEK